MPVRKMDGLRASDTLSSIHERLQRRRVSFTASSSTGASFALIYRLTAIEAAVAAEDEVMADSVDEEEVIEVGSAEEEATVEVSEEDEEIVEDSEADAAVDVVEEEETRWQR